MVQAEPEIQPISEEEFERRKAARVAAGRHRYETEGDDPPSDDLADELA